jgi:hypothetical protein
MLNSDSSSVVVENPNTGCKPDQKKFMSVDLLMPCLG